MGNSEFCHTFVNIEVDGKQNSPFLTGPVIKCFIIHPNPKLEKTKNGLLYVSWLINCCGEEQAIRSRLKCLAQPTHCTAVTQGSAQIWTNSGQHACIRYFAVTTVPGCSRKYLHHPHRRKFFSNNPHPSGNFNKPVKRHKWLHGTNGSIWAKCL